MNQQYPPSPVPHGTSLPSREMVTNLQFQTVLDILEGLQPYLLLTQRELDAGFPKELEGGIVSSASATFIKACGRLDSMLDDGSRWNLKENDALYEAMTAHYAGSAEVTKRQVDAIAKIQSPSGRLKPQLTTIAGEFIAFWGDASLPGGMLIGRGATPVAALEDFDAAFLRDVATQIRFAPASEERLKGEPPMSKSKKKKRKSGY